MLGCGHIPEKPLCEQGRKWTMWWLLNPSFSSSGSSSLRRQIVPQGFEVFFPKVSHMNSASQLAFLCKRSLVSVWILKLFTLEHIIA